MIVSNVASLPFEPTLIVVNWCQVFGSLQIGYISLSVTTYNGDKVKSDISKQIQLWRQKRKWIYLSKYKSGYKIDPSKYKTPKPK